MFFRLCEDRNKGRATIIERFRSHWGMEMFNKPLRNFRVLDLTNVLSGPFCCHQLAHLGADVIKIEVPGTGDLARQLGADPDLNDIGMGISFLAQNAGKKSITINLKNTKGKEIFLALVRSADVLVENFRPGVMNRLGLGFDDLKLENPALVYCAISGFGANGPLKNLPAYDQIIQGMSGVMSITGDEETAPYRVGYPIADTIGGMTAAFAISSVLAGRSRNLSEPVFIDVSMLESTLATMGWVVSNHLVAGQSPSPMGNENFTASPSGTFKTADAPLNIAANKQEQFEALCRVVGLQELIEDRRFAERSSRLINRKELKCLLEGALATKPASEWETFLNAANVPAGRVLSVPEALSQPHIRSRGFISTFEDVPGVGKVEVVRTGFKLNGLTPEVHEPPPHLGQHSDQILCDLGYCPEEIQNFRKEGVI
jgi:crotonobetainyl-CoA:carnitine CoA-transferase CaiB-like acyl-CoA transferase